MSLKKTDSHESPFVTPQRTIRKYYIIRMKKNLMKPSLSIDLHYGINKHVNFIL